MRPRQVRYQAALRPDPVLDYSDEYALLRVLRRGTCGVPVLCDSSLSHRVMALRGYNYVFAMPGPLFAIVAYVRANPVGEFVESLRRDLHPEHPELPAHLTILPPRTLNGGVDEAQRHIEEVCCAILPFEVVMGDVETFAPITPTVFIRVAHAAYRMRELHDKLNAGALAYDEPWPYMPHLTVVKVSESEAARRAADLSRRRWAEFQGPRRILLDELTFVQQGQDPYSWIDLAPIPLGTRLAKAR